MEQHEPVTWHCHSRLEKFWAGAAEPYEVIEEDGNLLLYVGASSLWERLIGTGVTAFNNANAYIAVGDSSTPAVATQTEIQAGSNRHSEAMDATYPIHTAGTDLAAASIVFKSTFETGDANFAWNEWVIKNNAAFGSGEVLNRKVVNYGTKTSSESWSLTLTLTLS